LFGGCRNRIKQRQGFASVFLFFHGPIANSRLAIAGQKKEKDRAPLNEQKNARLFWVVSAKFRLNREPNTWWPRFLSVKNCLSGFLR
jgi:hypothetical protein